MGIWSDGLALAEGREIWGDEENVNSEVIRPAENLGLIHSLYKHGECLSTVDTARAIADALSVSLDYLTGLTDQLTDSTTRARLEAISALPDDDRTFVLRAIDSLVRDTRVQKAYAV